MLIFKEKKATKDLLGRYPAHSLSSHSLNFPSEIFYSSIFNKTIWADKQASRQAKMQDSMHNCIASLLNMMIGMDGLKAWSLTGKSNPKSVILQFNS